MTIGHEHKFHSSGSSSPKSHHRKHNERFDIVASEILTHDPSVSGATAGIALPSPENEAEPAYESEKELGPFRYKVKKATESKPFHIIVAGAIFLNGIQMGLQADYSGGAWEPFFEVLEHLFTFIFTVEMLFKVVAFRAHVFKDRWNCFDIAVTTMSIVDTWILGIFEAQAGNMNQFTVLRILRIFRVLRLLRTLRHFKELRLLVEGLLASARTSSWMSILLLLIIYISAVFCCQVIGQQSELYEKSFDPDNGENWSYVDFDCKQFFGGMSRSMFTLTNVAILADDWTVVSRAVFERQPYLIPFFLIYIIFVNWGVLNLIVGIMVENVHHDSEDIDDERNLEEMENLYMVKNTIFSVLGHDDGVIDMKDLEEGWNLPDLKQMKDLLGLPPLTSANDMMDLIDSDGDRELTVDEFALGILRVAGSDERQHIIGIKATVNALKQQITKLLNTTGASNTTSTNPLVSTSPGQDDSNAKAANRASSKLKDSMALDARTPMSLHLGDSDHPKAGPMSLHSGDSDVPKGDFEEGSPVAESLQMRVRSLCELTLSMHEEVRSLRETVDCIKMADSNNAKLMAEMNSSIKHFTALLNSTVEKANGDNEASSRAKPSVPLPPPPPPPPPPNDDVNRRLAAIEGKLSSLKSAILSSNQSSNGAAHQTSCGPTTISTQTATEVAGPVCTEELAAMIAGHLAALLPGARSPSKESAMKQPLSAFPLQSPPAQMKVGTPGPGPVTPSSAFASNQDPRSNSFAMRSPAIPENGHLGNSASPVAPRLATPNGTQGSMWNRQG